MLVLHSAYIVASAGKAILFSGPSGVGKSTQAALWERCAGARVVNGDRALVDVGKKTANGIFYSGTSGISENVTAPVRAIVLLGQGSENRVLVPSPQAAFAGVLSQCAYYEWDVSSAEKNDRMRGAACLRCAGAAHGLLAGRHGGRCPAGQIGRYLIWNR